jgi:plastocyanin
MNKHPLDDRPSSNRFAALILISVAIPCALILYSHFFSKPTSTRIDQSRQEAGETSIANNEMFSNGGILQRDLIGNEKPQEYLHLQTGSKGHTFVPSEITVRAGEIVSVTLKNQNKRSPSENWVLLNPGTTQEVKEATRNEPKSWDWVPKNPNVLAFVPATESGKAITRIFRAPKQPGDYPYICTSSDQCAETNGVMHVVD